MIFAWLLVGAFVAVSGGLLIAAIYGPDELEDLRGLSAANPLPTEVNGGLPQDQIESAATGARAPMKGRP